MTLKELILSSIEDSEELDEQLFIKAHSAIIGNYDLPTLVEEYEDAINNHMNKHIVKTLKKDFKFVNLVMGLNESDSECFKNPQVVAITKEMRTSLGDKSAAKKLIDKITDIIDSAHPDLHHIVQDSPIWKCSHVLNGLVQSLKKMHNLVAVSAY